MDDFDLTPPEPPKGGSEESLSSSNSHDSIPQPDEPKPKKKGFFSKIFGKKESEETTDDKELFQKVEFDSMAVPSAPSAEVQNAALDQTSEVSSDDLKFEGIKTVPEEPASNLPESSQLDTFPAHDEILAPPKVDMLNQDHQKELDNLRQKLGIDSQEITVPKPEPIDISDNHDFLDLPQMPLNDEPDLVGSLPEVEHNVFDKMPVQEEEEDKKGLMSSLTDAMDESENFTPFTQEPTDNQGISEIPKVEDEEIEEKALQDPFSKGIDVADDTDVDVAIEEKTEKVKDPTPIGFDWTNDAIPDSPATRIMSGTMKKTDKGMEISVGKSQELQWASDKKQPKVVKPSKSEDQPPDKSLSILSEEQIQEIMKGLSDEDKKFSTDIKTIEDYITVLQTELKEVVNTPRAYVMLKNQKKQLKEQLRKLKLRRAKKGTPESDSKVQEQNKLVANIKFIQEKEKSDYNLPLFFKLYRETSISSLLKLLKTIEDTYKIDLDDVIIKSKADFQSVMNRLISYEQVKAKTNLDQIKKELQSVIDTALENAGKAVEEKREDIEKEFDSLQKEREQVEKRRVINLVERDAINRDHANLQGIIDRKISQIKEQYNKKEDLLKNEFELKDIKHKQALDDFSRLKKKQELDIFAEIQQIEKLKKDVEGHQFVLEDDKREFEDQKNAYMQEKKKLKEDLLKDITDIKEQKNMITKEMTEEKIRLEGLENEYNKRIRSEYDTKSKDLETRRKNFEKYRIAQQKKLNQLITDAHKEESDLKTLKIELTGQEKRVKAMIHEQKSQIEADLTEIRNIDINLKKVEENILHQKMELEKEGFKKYIKSKLSNIDPVRKAEGLPTDVLEETDIDMVNHNELNGLIDGCKLFIQEKDLGNAEKEYNRIRDKFNAAQLSSDDKSLIYNKIRELYDDIHLLSLNSAA